LSEGHAMKIDEAASGYYGPKAYNLIQEEGVPS
jgi:hypothetical protein